MATKQFKFTGTHGVIVFVVAILLFVGRFNSLSDQRDNKALVEKVVVEINSEFYPETLNAMKQAVQSGNYEDVEALTDKLKETVDNPEIMINALSVSSPLFGFTSNQTVVIKVIFTLPTQQSRLTRYYYYQHNALANSWSYNREATVVAYYLNFI